MIVLQFMFVARSYAECVERRDVTLLFGLDVSPSMLESVGSVTRLDLALAFGIDIANGINATGSLDESGAYSFCELVPAAETTWKNAAGVTSDLAGAIATCGGTAVYNAIVWGAGTIKTRDASNLRLLVVLTDGEDTSSPLSPSDASSALSSGVVSRLVSIGGGASVLSSIASSAGPSSEPLSASPSALSSLVDEVVDATCTNHRPNANFSISDTDLRLGVEGFTIDFNGSSSSDQETSDSGLDFDWTFTRPDGTSFTRTGKERTETFNDDQLGSGENWQVRLRVTDPGGSSDTRTKSFSVRGSPPDISCSVPDVDALQSLSLSASPTNDVDGGPLDYEWTVLSAPVGAQHSSGASFTSKDFSFVTTQEDIGDWEFRCRAMDDEGDTDEKVVGAHVRNLPPQINFVGLNQIDVGDSIQVETTFLDDPDNAGGGGLIYQWDIIQTPNGASPFVQLDFSGSPGIHIITESGDEGTWIFELTVTDDEDPPWQESVTEEFYVVVDGIPVAQIDGPEIVGLLSLPVTLNGDNSLDPDSPCLTDPFRCHETLDGTLPRHITDGIDFYQWELLDVPFEHFPDYLPGSVDDVFGVAAFGSDLTFFPGDIPPGEWTFQLTVRDAEGNFDATTARLEIVEPDIPPFAIALPLFRRYEIDAFTTTAADIQIDGSASFDLDNILMGDTIAGGVGITDYTWTVLSGPPTCTAVVPPSGAAANVFTLFSAGSAVPLECHGSWKVELMVTDDDVTPRSNSTEVDLSIGNCPSQICIDFPTQIGPELIEFTDDTDILIYYHVDSGLYGNPLFNFGAFVNLRIHHESDLATPIYTDSDPNVLPSNFGGLLSFHWNGFSDHGDRPQPGRYTVSLEVVDALFAVSAVTATELDAIIIEVSEPEILPSSESFVDRDELDASTDTLTLDWQILGSAMPDSMALRIFDSADIPVFTDIVPLASSGTYAWDGQVGGTTVAADQYSAELETIRAGASMGISPRFEFTIYELGLVPTTGPVGSTLPGLFLYANTDDDNANNVSDLTETATGEDDLIEINLEMTPAIPGTVTVSTGSAPASLRLWDTPAKGTQTTLPATFAIPAGSLPASLHMEGESPGNTNLSIEILTDSGQTLGPKSIAITIVELQFMLDSNDDHSIGVGDSSTYDVGVANWDGAYDPAFALRNNPDPNNLVERDAKRFYFRVHDASSKANAGAPDPITVRVSTQNGLGATDDAAHDVVLMETGNDTGIFISPSQILMSHDIQVIDDANADDEINVHDGSAGIVADDAARDRTHRVEIDGNLTIDYRPAAAAATKTWSAPVCARTPEERRRAPLEVIVFQEPFLDVGLDGIPGTADAGEGDGIFNFTDTDGSTTHDAGEASEPYIDLSHGGAAPPLSGAAGGIADGRGPVISNPQVLAQTVRSDIAWAQACISTELPVPIRVVNAPTIAGVDILLDGSVNLGTDDVAIYAAHGGAMTTSRTYVFFAAPIAGANAISYPPANTAIAHGEDTFVLMAPNLIINRRTLAHELGHVFANQPDSVQDPPIFFPQGLPVNAGFNDSDETTYRRISPATATRSRTVRPAGSLMAPGNSVLRTP